MIVQIDKDILDSLKGFYFNDYSDIIKAACYRAYRDFNRTIDFPVKMKDLDKFEKKKEENERLELKNSILDLFRTMISKLPSINELDQRKFDCWHNSVCASIINKYNNKNIKLKYGQAQKWINMTIKYLYCLGENFDKEFPFLHIPVDKYILDIALERLKIEKPKSVWSSWNHKEYNDYQIKLRNAMKDEPPLRWEFHSWLSAARNHNSEK